MGEGQGEGIRQHNVEQQKQKSPQSGLFCYLSGWGAGIRTPECWYQKPEPYRLATPQLR